jgi:ALG6, ALG8 glycosyltransferase family
MTTCTWLRRVQVHEKSILMPMMPLALTAHMEPAAASIVLPVSLFSMYPLLVRDGNAVPYAALLLATVVLLPVWLAPGQAADGSRDERRVTQPPAEDASTGQGRASATSATSGADSPYGGASLSDRGGDMVFIVQRAQPTPASFVLMQGWFGICRPMHILSVTGMLSLHVLRMCFTPPAHLPFLHDLLAASFSFVRFFILLGYCTVKQLRVPAERWIWCRFLRMCNRHEHATNE